MKKLGFTLMEILMALAIVGVVAALTIPSFVANSQTQAREAIFAATVSDVENALTTMIVIEEANDLMETRFYDSLNTSATADDTADILGNHLKLADATETLSVSEYTGEKKPLAEGNYQFTLKTGAFFIVKLAVDEDNEKFADAWIDVNGQDLPNNMNIDIRKYNLMLDGSLELDED